MPLTRALAAAAGLAALAAAWLVLPALPGHGFTRHMAMHLAVIAVAAPLLALAAAGSRADPARAAPALVSPVPGTLLELVVVWAWHAPALRAAVAASPAVAAVEQASFLIAGLVLWGGVFGGLRRQRLGAGVLGLLLTSMHMTLLGTLLTLAPRPLYGAALLDQQRGGILMLAVGGTVYLLAGLALMARLLRQPAAAR